MGTYGPQVPMYPCMYIYTYIFIYTQKDGIVWVGKDLRKVSPIPCNEQEHLQLDEVTQNPVQPDLKCFKGRGIHHLSGKPVPVFHHPHVITFSLY